jgi:site-specific recombinase XerD
VGPHGFESHSRRSFTRALVLDGSFLFDNSLSWGAAIHLVVQYSLLTIVFSLLRALCRHWFTTHLRRNDMRREFIKELRGDSRNEAIDIYDHIDKKELKRAYLAAIPMLGIE